MSILETVHSIFPFFKLYQKKKTLKTKQWWEPSQSEIEAEWQKQWLYLKQKQPRLKHLLKESPPMIMGGVGGSGTRLVAKILQDTQQFGLLFSSSESLDSYSNRYCDLNEEKLIFELIRATKSLHYKIDSLPESLAQKINVGTSQLIDSILSEGRSLKTWGWKEPKIIYWLPALIQKIPQLKFVHIIRDARSINQFHIEESAQLYEAFFEQKAPDDSRQRFEEVWARVNLDLKNWGEKFLQENYHLVHVENLIGNNKEVYIEKLLSFAEVKVTKEISQKISCLARPLKPFKKEPREGLVQEALKTFGYS